jgi:hypothetical protein
MNFNFMILDIFIVRCYIVDTRKYDRIFLSDERKPRLRKFGNYFLFEKATHIIMIIEVRTAKVMCFVVVRQCRFSCFLCQFRQ